jgi:glycosyltransferase involved in cell wall biosynthesis
VNIHGVTGFLSDPGNVEEMADYAVQLLSNEEMLQRFRNNALEQARRFDIGNILPHYEAYYEEVLANSVVKIE